MISDHIKLKMNGPSKLHGRMGRRTKLGQKIISLSWIIGWNF